MTALTPQQKERLRTARSRAGHIRYGMQVIADTWIYIARARAEGDHLTLGYETWDDYVDGEFGEHRVKLPPEKRAAAIAGLAAVGLTQRETAYTLGVSQPTVHRALAAGRDSDESSAEDEGAGQLVVDALHQAIDEATERAEDHREPAPGEAEPVRGVATEPGTAVGEAGRSRHGPVPASPTTAEEADARPASSRASSGDPRPEPAPPPGRGSSPDVVPPMPPESYALVRDGERRAALVGRVVEALDELMAHAADPAQIVGEVLPTMRHRLAVVIRAHDYLTRLREEIENHERVQPSAA